MKKNQEFEGVVETVKFPDRGIVKVEDTPVMIKGTIAGQKIQGRVTKKRRNKCEGRLLSVLEKAPHEVEPFCKHFGAEGCGGCAIQQLSYEDQLLRKQEQVRELFKDAGIIDYKWKGI
ncbi:MAG TPA: 23S rRNA (uracil-5-)-methyltransferase RumA, partial [Epulopiscium sp.]|nr:23S rRNA (uracil-5-)-methyltransferase RumA [Candidatus Epulonipiscium sp.]